MGNFLMDYTTLKRDKLKMSRWTIPWNVGNKMLFMIMDYNLYLAEILTQLCLQKKPYWLKIKASSFNTDLWIKNILDEKTKKT